MKHNLDTTHDPALGVPRFPRFRTGQAVTVHVPQGHVQVRRVSIARLACGNMFRVLRVYPFSCLCLELRTLQTHEIEKADLCPW